MKTILAVGVVCGIGVVVFACLLSGVRNRRDQKSNAYIIEVSPLT